MVVLHESSSVAVKISIDTLIKEINFVHMQEIEFEFRFESFLRNNLDIWSINVFNK